MSNTIKNVTKVKHIKNTNAGFKNENGISKIEARKKMTMAAKNSINKAKKILSLPSKNPILEELFHKRISKKFHFVMCEKDQDKFRTMVFNALNTFTNNVPEFYCGTIGDKIYAAKENEYSHLLLDYCGEIGTFADEIEYAIKNDIVEISGTIAITVNKRISMGIPTTFKNEMLELNPQRINDENTVSEHIAETFINRIGGRGYKLETVFPYFDTAAMILFIIRRIK